MTKATEEEIDAALFKFVVVIGDATFLDLYVLYDIPYVNIIFGVNTLKYLTPRILYNLIKSITRDKLTISEIYLNYMKLVIESMDTKIVLTFIDNDPLFHWLSRNTSAKFYAIQNGKRNEYDLDIPYKISMPNLICFGKNDEVFYKKYNHTIDNFICKGSLKGSEFIHMYGSTPNKNYDICIVSQYRDAIFNNTQRPEIKFLWDELCVYLKRYFENHKVRVCVAMSTNELQEQQYYESFFGKNAGIHFFEKREGKWDSTYWAMDFSEVSITVESTATTEAYGWGAKVLDYTPFCGYIKFEQRLTNLISMDGDTYKRENLDRMKYVMDYDHNQPLSDYIRELIKNEVL